MPITSNASYFIAVPLFLNHWQDVNDELGDELALDGESLGQVGDVLRANLDTLFTSLGTQRDMVESVLLDASLANADVLGHKTWLQAHAVNFNQVVRADHGSTKFAGALPLAPAVSDGRERFMKPLRLLAMLWPKINAYRAASVPAKPAMVLGDATTLAQFNTRMTAARSAMETAEEREQQAGLERRERDAIQDAIYPLLRTYRLKVEALFPEGSPLRETLPALSEDSTATPQPGSLAGVYNGSTQKADLTGTASPSPSVVRHQLRAAVGEEPEVADEVVREEFALGAPLVHSSNYGLGAPGTTVHWRLVAITADGHEKGSPWLTIQRPL